MRSERISGREVHFLWVILCHILRPPTAVVVVAVVEICKVEAVIVLRAVRAVVAVNV